ncbi:TIGR03618 family F420-dependent PPOX class oxidoreductase [Micromonospora carbonacea]|uniref:PPOX class probable F420-dependent enzyme, Rv3369 family n=1 Tax=Micromonospora carbonacea TaxID=47853 RepID=A0A1C4U1A3_9ACTN|nr:TIGR03618 family F420-dependent PPOX class oxidoreductase [Micromonospora carbonacea]SCE65483.1 PPOX class probable F420-dependent enzyme, Rv3369 family [Micromonospora carbonacea]
MIGHPAPGPEVLDRLAQERIVWLCTVRPDGSPHVTPVWFLFRDDEWCIWTQERNRKVRNIVADPRVSLALPDGKFPVVAEGAAVVVREPFPGWAADEFRRKYDWDVTAPAGPAGDNVLIRVAVTRWLMAGTAS